ncbi:CBS domain-containing protein [Sporosarcina aquimarina]|uniref:CBS domain-containing protein n=1 Tax=Sporosarcina aquimarina TaxID=114975 RepID=A0ABU4FYW0_9BACL|nr:CBS domain-containing protein [Sporosarcina aquimarina]MDW0109902.1 CBS domain-containing protein [Sporosarcina aquimarina]
MRVRDLFVERNYVTTVNDTDTAAQALEKIRKSGFRSVPVVDSNDNYKGMIYKIHLIEYLYEQNGNADETLDKIVKHQEDCIEENSSFLDALLKIKALPFIAVTDHGKLSGILTHNKIEGVFEDAFGVNTGGLNLTISSTEARGMIEKLARTLRGENIEGMLTLDNGSVLVRRVVLTLEGEKSESEIDALRTKLEKAGFRILQIERLEKKI